MSLRQAALRLGISPYRANRLLAEQKLVGVKRIAASGHERLDVCAASVEQLKQEWAAAGLTSDAA